MEEYNSEPPEQSCLLKVYKPNKHKIFHIFFNESIPKKQSNNNTVEISTPHPTHTDPPPKFPRSSKGNNNLKSLYDFTFPDMTSPREGIFAPSLISAVEQEAMPSGFVC
jgi:hypothetical protein